MDENNKCTIYLIRHGQTIWNVEGRLQGYNDTPLTELGIQQAYDLRKEFKKIKIDKIFSSDLLRAKRTAEIIAAEKDLIVETTKLLRERAFGKLEGEKYEQYDIKLKDKIEIYNQLSDDKKYLYKFADDIESDEEIISKFVRFAKDVTTMYINKNILMVTHGIIIKTFLIYSGYFTYEQLEKLHVENTAYAKITFDGNNFEVKELFGIYLR